MSKEITVEQRAKMDEIVFGMEGVSQKIRALGAAGYARADIARYLNKRYQHVRNILVQDEAKRNAKTQLADDGGPWIDRPAMADVVAGLRTKADKIRAMGAAGYSTSEIASFLAIRYQHAYNVLNENRDLPESATVGPDGRIVIPVQFRRILQIEPGDEVRLKIENGELRVIGKKAAIEQAQALVRKFVPEGVSLSDELIAERRAEAAKEGGAG